MSRGAHEADDDEEEDEETLQLKLQAIEAKLKLKALQKARKAAEGGDSERSGASLRPSTVPIMRRAELSRPSTKEEVQVPHSPVRQRQAPLEPRSPARVLLGIDKGLKAQDVSLKRPAVGVTGGSSRSNSSRSDIPKIKSFSERLAESRNKEKEREENQTKIEQRRNRGFGLQNILQNIKQSEQQTPSRSGSSLSSGTRSARDAPQSTHQDSSRVPSRSTNDLRHPPAPHPSSKVAPRSEASRPPFSVPNLPSNKPAATQTASKYAEISQRDNSSEAPSFESFSGLHLKSREMQHNVVARTLEGKTILTIPQMLKTVKAPDYDSPDWENDYVVLGLICSTSAPLNTKNAVRENTKGNQERDQQGKFMVIKLTDLKYELDLFLFDTGFSKFWKLPVGTLIAILNPDIMPPRNRDKGSFSLKLSSSDDTILELGTARDLDFCHAQRKDGKECGSWIDSRKTEYCEFHIQMQVEKSKRGRMEVNSMVGMGKGSGGGGKFGMFGGGRGGGLKGEELKREGRYHDRELHETVYIAPRPGGSAQLIDRDEQSHERGASREERFRKQLTAKEKERELAKKLGTMGEGSTGGDYLKLKGADTPNLPARGSMFPGSSSTTGPEKSADSDFTSLLNRKAEDVTLASTKRKRIASGKSTASSAPMGWGGAFKRGMLPSPTKESSSALRNPRETSPAKKKARLLVPDKGIREPGRESLGGLDVGLIAAMDEDDDDLETSSSLRWSKQRRHYCSAVSQIPLPPNPSILSSILTVLITLKVTELLRPIKVFGEMAATTDQDDGKIYAVVNYEDPYVQPLILAALERRLPPATYELMVSITQLPSLSLRLLQFVQYESIDFDHLMEHSSTSLANAYIIRKALIRKHYLSTTIANWITKYPDSILKKHVKPGVEFEVDYAEFLDDALVEAWDLKESWARNEDKEEKEREWWILKPGMSDRGQGIRLFSSEEELTAIFEEWDPPSDDEDEVDDARSDAKETSKHEETDTDGIMTSQLRHFIAQPYIHPPLLLSPPSSPPSEPRKFHIRTYVLATGALKVNVYRPMLALFAARSYVPPWDHVLQDDREEAMKAHLTNTCLQDTGDREGSVGLFWSLPDDIPTQPTFSASTPKIDSKNWKESIFAQLCATTAATFEAAARGMSIHFQPLSNAFEIFGLDFMVSIESNGELRCWLLEVNAFPDFRQSGGEGKELVQGLFDGVIDKGVAAFFGLEGGKEDSGDMVEVLNIDLGRR
ncbi:TTL-domain-containing protein [Setomelanomma holmii]|uniref:TTL-domain-containing protein n=1 Tax=Setomelanomma holmii TaxID=210430 RepID=A0A9P4GWD3_9PLEO|nr:TTL-domain-containing protein [Setomelanomma holmii]